LDLRGGGGIIVKISLKGALWSVLVTKHHSGDQVEEIEMSRACSTYGREERSGAYRALVGKPERKRLLLHGVFIGRSTDV
jgi:hypothetical protein